MASVRDTWPELSGTLSSLVDALASDIGAVNVDHLREFIEHREYGVAFDWLNAVIQNRAISLTAAQQAALGRLAELMKLDI